VPRACEKLVAYENGMKMLKKIVLKLFIICFFFHIWCLQINLIIWFNVKQKGILMWRYSSVWATFLPRSAPVMCLFRRTNRSCYKHGLRLVPRPTGLLMRLFAEGVPSFTSKIFIGFMKNWKFHKSPSWWLGGLNPTTLLASYTPHAPKWGFCEFVLINRGQY